MRHAQLMRFSSNLSEMTDEQLIDELRQCATAQEFLNAHIDAVFAEGKKRGFPVILTEEAPQTP